MRAPALALLCLLPRAEAAEPPRLFLGATPALQPERAAFATAGLSHRGDLFVAGTVGFAGLADLSLEWTDVGLGPTGAAVFKARLWGRSALGLRKTTPGPAVAAEVFLVGAIRLGPLDLVGGGQLWDARSDAAAPLHARPWRDRVRPSAGLAWHPPQFPRTTVLADLVFRPRREGERVELAGTASWGIRYQALSWGSIELGVHMHEGHGLGGSTVFVRVNAHGTAAPRR